MPHESRRDLRALAAFYLAYYGTIGATLPTMSPFLRGRGLSAIGMTELLAVGPALTTFLPPLWGYVADRTGRGAWILRASAAAAGLAYLAAAAGSGVMATILAIILLSLSQTPVAAVSDGLTSLHAVRAGTAFARTRLWGSIGFVSGALASAAALKIFRLPATTSVPVWIAGGCALAAAAVAFRVRGLPAGAAGASPPSVHDAGKLLRSPALRALLAGAALHWAALAPYHAFLSVRFADLGHPPHLSALAMALAVTCEVAMFFGYARLFAGRAPAALAAVTCAVSCARWAMTAWMTDPWALVAIQAFHGLTFGVWYAANNAALGRLVPDALRSTGQALFVACAFGAGGVGGFALSGRLYAHGGSAWCFGGAAVLDLFATATLVVAAVRASREARAPTAYRPS